MEEFDPTQEEIDDREETVIREDEPQVPASLNEWLQQSTPEIK